MGYILSFKDHLGSLLGQFGLETEAEFKDQDVSGHLILG